MTDVLITATAYGRRVGIRIPDKNMAAARQRLPHWWVDADVEPERVWPIAGAGDIGPIIGEVELWVAEHAIDLIFVHAGVVAVDGRALLLPGRSFSGKTTLTEALIRGGAQYGSDEYAVIDSKGLVHPYPRPLSIRGEAENTRLPATALGAETFEDALPIGAVAVLHYDPDASYCTKLISPAVAVLRLLDNTLCANSRPAAALAALVAGSRRISAVEGRRGCATASVKHVLGLLR